MSDLSITLKKIRERHNITIAKLSELSGVGSGTIGDIETGKNKSTIKTLDKLSKALNLNDDERSELFSSFVPKDIGTILINYSKKNNENEYELSEEKAQEIGLFLKNKREELGYSTNQISIKTNIDKSDISRIENGEKKKLNPIYLKKIAKILKLDIIELFKMVGYLDEDIEIHTKKESFEIKNVIRKIVYFPVYGKASAGNGYLNLEQEIYKMPILDEDFPDGCFFVKIEGNSMEPTIIEGEFALVDPNDIEYEKNKIYVVTYDDESFIKRMVVDEKTGIVILKSDNKEYDDILIDIEKQEYLKINGRVIKIISSRKAI